MRAHKSILIITPTPFFADRGCHIRIYEEAKILKKLEYDVIVCTYHHGKEMVSNREMAKLLNYMALGLPTLKRASDLWLHSEQILKSLYINSNNT